jgi:hypothetical protein
MQSIRSAFRSTTTRRKKARDPLTGFYRYTVAGSTYWFPSKENLALHIFLNDSSYPQDIRFDIHEAAEPAVPKPSEIYIFDALLQEAIKNDLSQNGTLNLPPQANNSISLPLIGRRPKNPLHIVLLNNMKGFVECLYNPAISRLPPLYGCDNLAPFCSWQSKGVLSLAFNTKAFWERFKKVAHENGVSEEHLSSLRGNKIECVDVRALLAASTYRLSGRLVPTLALTFSELRTNTSYKRVLPWEQLCESVTNKALGDGMMRPPDTTATESSNKRQKTSGGAREVTSAADGKKAKEKYHQLLFQAAIALAVAGFEKQKKGIHPKKGKSGVFFWERKFDESQKLFSPHLYFSFFSFFNFF